VSVLFGYVSKIYTRRSALQPPPDFFLVFYFPAPETATETEKRHIRALITGNFFTFIFFSNY